VLRIEIHTKAGGQGFDAAPDETILAAALRQGVRLPYECATGTCGTCRARLLDGDVDEGWPDAPGRAGLKAAKREFLTCQARARTACTLQPVEPLPPEPEDAVRPAAVQARIAAREPLTHDMMRLVLRLERSLAFAAGQFALLRAPGLAGWRAYSMANAEAPAASLEFVVKRKPGGGLTGWLFDTAAPGDAVELYGPLGGATFGSALDTDLLAIVGGSGLAVALAVLGRAVAEGYLPRHRARLFFGVRGERDLCELQRLDGWRESLGERFAVTVALSDAPPTAALAGSWPRLDFAHGPVHEVAERALAGGAGNATAFLAGPPPMVEAALRSLMLRVRLPPGRIRYDKFS